MFNEGKNLRMKEELFRDFFDNAAVGFHIFGPDRIIKDMNKYELNLLGYSREEIIDKKTWYDLIVPEQSHQFEKHWNEILDEGSVKNLEYTLIHRDGHFIDVLLSASSRFDELGNLINTRGSVIDITRRRKTEQALRVSEHNLGERIKELNCLYGISQLVEKPEVSIEEIIRGTLELIPPAWQFPEVTCARITYYKKVYKTENFKETEWKLIARVEVNEKPMEIEVYYLEVNPFLKEEINLINDIGKRLKVIFEHIEAEQEIKESEEKFKALFNNVNDPLFIHDHGGKFIEVNKTACDVLGYSKEELMNLNPKDIAPPRIIELLPEMIKTLYEKGYNTFESEFLTKDGRIIPVELNSRIFDYKEN